MPGKIEIYGRPGRDGAVRAPCSAPGCWPFPADAKNPKRGPRVHRLRDLRAANQKALALEFGTPRPTRASIYADADVVAKYRWYPAQLKALQQARPRPRITQWSKVEAVLGDYLQLALIGEMKAKDALSEANRQVARALSR